jgi:DNA helicase II / ATP-dependent DNA helicase PcrA
MHFLCNLCELEMDALKQSDLPLKSCGCAHSWTEGEQGSDPTLSILSMPGKSPSAIVSAGGKITSLPKKNSVPAPTQSPVNASTARTSEVTDDCLCSDGIQSAVCPVHPSQPVIVKKPSALQRTTFSGPAAHRNRPSPLASRLHQEAEKRHPHLIVEARAGTGKTFTLVVGVINMFRLRDPSLWEKLKSVLGFDPIPTPQQAKVWESMALSLDARTIQFTAFNKSIVREFEDKWGWVIEALRGLGVTLAFNTNHSMGFAAVRKAFNQVQVDEYRVMNLISELLGKDIRELRRDKFEMLKGTERLVGLCKMNLLDGENQDDLAALVSHHDLDIDGYRAEVFDLVPKILSLCKDPSKDRKIDYNDMVWLPCVHKLTVTKNDLLLVDEAQDLNRCQQALAKMAGHRLILVGDPKQAIYGFAGADVDSMPRMTRELGETQTKCEVLPLTMTRRCGKAIVKEANKIVPDFEAFEGNPEGEVLEALYPTFQKGGKNEERKFEETYMAKVQDGDMVLCRVNAPLVSQCFRFLKRGVKANIQGRDVGQGLITTIQKMGAESIPILISKVGDWLEVESSKERAKRNPSELRIIALQDRHDCILAFTDSAKDVTEVIRRIEVIFTDDQKREGVRLSSIHKAKGLEAKRVFLLQPKGASIPHPMAKSTWQIGQEMNLKYVAITRAIQQLYFVY